MNDLEHDLRRLLEERANGLRVGLEMPAPIRRAVRRRQLRTVGGGVTITLTTIVAVAALTSSMLRTPIAEPGAGTEPPGSVSAAGAVPREFSGDEATGTYDGHAWSVRFGSNEDGEACLWVTIDEHLEDRRVCPEGGFVDADRLVAEAAEAGVLLVGGPLPDGALTIAPGDGLDGEAVDVTCGNPRSFLDGQRSCVAVFPPVSYGMVTLLYVSEDGTVVSEEPYEWEYAVAPSPTPPG